MLNLCLTVYIYIGLADFLDFSELEYFGGSFLNSTVYIGSNLGVHF